MTVTIARYNPDTRERRDDVFDVPVTDKRQMSVLDVLDYIAYHLDPTIAYYKHSTCNHGICGRCSVLVNGKVRLACLELANTHEALALEPVPGRTLVADLVTKL